MSESGREGSTSETGRLDGLGQVWLSEGALHCAQHGMEAVKTSWWEEIMQCKVFTELDGIKS